MKTQSFTIPLVHRPYRNAHNASGKQQPIPARGRRVALGQPKGGRYTFIWSTDGRNATRPNFPGHPGQLLQPPDQVMKDRSVTRSELKYS